MLAEVAEYVLILVRLHVQMVQASYYKWMYTRIHIER